MLFPLKLPCTHLWQVCVPREERPSWRPAVTCFRWETWVRRAPRTSHLCTRCHQELERRSIDTCEHSGVKTTLQGLSADFTELLAGAGARGIPPVICSLETGGAELLSCQEFDFWPQLFLPSWSCPSSHRSPRLLKRCTVHCSFLSHPRNA